MSNKNGAAPGIVEEPRLRVETETMIHEFFPLNEGQSLKRMDRRDACWNGPAIVLRQHHLDAGTVDDYHTYVDDAKVWEWIGMAIATGKFAGKVTSPIKQTRRKTDSCG